MTDSTDTAKTDETPGTPPWGDDFDPARAWKLIVDLRADKVALQTERDEIKAERDTLQTERQAREEEANAAKEAAAKAASDLRIERAVRKHKVPDEFADLVRGDTDEEVEAIAERLSKIGKPAEKPEPDADAEKAPDEPKLPAKPRPNLQPGHGGEDGVKNDLDAIVKSVRG
jgi:hypothetical protein